MPSFNNLDSDDYYIKRLIEVVEIYVNGFDIIETQ